MSDQTQFDLPDECWELVFRSLDYRRHYDSVSSVCKRFLSIINGLHSSLTILDSTIPLLSRLFLRFPAINSINLSYCGGDIHSVLRLISRSGLSLDSLDLSYRKELLVDGLRLLGSTMRNLRVLRYSGASFIEDDVLVVIADCFPSLQELDISYPSPGFTRAVTDMGITTLATTLKDLRKVNLTGNHSVTDESLLSVCENCEFLTEITIHYCYSITPVGVSSAIRRRPTLTSISLSTKENEGPNITSDVVNSLTNLKGLTEISLTYFSVPDELLCSIAEQGLPLKKLILKYCREYTCTGILRLLSKCQSVQHLDLEANDFLTDNDVVNLSGFLCNLTFINLSHCYKLTTSTILTLARCPLLNEIVIERGMRFNEIVIERGMRFNTWREKVSLKDLVVNSQIKTLHLGRNFELKDKNVKTFAFICPNLEYIDLSHCKYISERGIAQVLKKCSKIRHLSLSFCSQLSLFDEINFNFLLPNLEMLDLSFTSIDDQSLSLISNTCCGLIYLELQNCSKVTAKGVKQVVQKCTRLREINLWKCTNVKTDIVHWMVFERPSLIKIKAPPGYDRSRRHKKYFSLPECLIF